MFDDEDARRRRRYQLVASVIMLVCVCANMALAYFTTESMSRNSMLFNGVMACSAVWMLIDYVNERVPKRRDEDAAD